MPTSNYYQCDVRLPSLIVDMFDNVPVMPSGQVKRVFQIVSRVGEVISWWEPEKG